MILDVMPATNTPVEAPIRLNLNLSQEVWTLLFLSNDGREFWMDNCRGAVRTQVLLPSVAGIPGIPKSRSCTNLPNFLIAILFLPLSSTLAHLPGP